MLSENIKNSRKSKGLSQDELAVKLNVVRQTVSKWERGLSVPDSEMLIVLSEVFEVYVSKLLGGNIVETKLDDLKVISEKLEVINLQLAQRKETIRKVFHGISIISCVVLTCIFIALLMMNGYLDWDYNDPELAVIGVIVHGFAWVFVRIFPFALVAFITGILLTRRKTK